MKRVIGYLGNVFNSRVLNMVLALLLVMVLVQPDIEVRNSRVVITLGPPEAYAAGTADYSLGTNGTANNISINTALASLPTQGGLLHFKVGSYNVSGIVTRAIGNVTIEGEGRGTYFYRDGASVIFTAGGINWMYKDFATDSPNAVVGGERINVNGVTSLTTANITTLNAPTGRTAYITVAPATAPANIKAQADFVGTGNSGNYSDDAILIAALNAAQVSSTLRNTTLVWLPGFYYITNTYTMNATKDFNFYSVGSTLRKANGTVASFDSHMNGYYDLGVFSVLNATAGQPIVQIKPVNGVPADNLIIWNESVLRINTIVAEDSAKVAGSIGLSLDATNGPISGMPIDVEMIIGVDTLVDIPNGNNNIRGNQINIYSGHIFNTFYRDVNSANITNNRITIGMDGDPPSGYFGANISSSNNQFNFVQAGISPNTKTNRIFLLNSTAQNNTIIGSGFVSTIGYTNNSSYNNNLFVFPYGQPNSITIPLTTSWTSSVNGSGTRSQWGIVDQLITGTTNNSYSLEWIRLQSINPLSNNLFEYNVKSELWGSVAKGGIDAGSTARIVIKATNTPVAAANSGVGIFIDGYTMYGEMSKEGSGNLTIPLNITMTDTQNYPFFIRYDGTRVEWFVDIGDGAGMVRRAVSTNSTYLPTGNPGATNLVAYIQNSASNVTNTLQFGNLQFKQYR